MIKRKRKKEAKPKKNYDGNNCHVSKKFFDHDVEENSPAYNQMDDSDEEDEAGEDDVQWLSF